MAKQRNHITWQYWILGINFLLIFVTALFPYTKDGFLKWRVLNHFNLAAEMNLAVWWSGSLLLLCGIIAYQFSRGDAASRAAWVAIALLFSFLSFDEVGSIHERVGNLAVGRQAYIAVALLAGLTLAYAIFVLWKNNTSRRTLLLLFTGIVLLASAAPNEYLEHHILWPSYLVGPRIAFEEGLELSGILVCLIGIASYQRDGQDRRLTSDPIRRKERFITIRKILLIGFVFHIGMAWMAVHSIEIGFRGNPAVWYFMAVFYLLAWSFLLKARAERSYLLLSGYFTVLSTSSMYFILPADQSFLPYLGITASPNLLLSVHFLLAFSLYIYVDRSLTWRLLLTFTFMAAVLAWSWYVNDQFVVYIVAGLLSLSTAMLFLSDGKNSVQSGDERFVTSRSA